MPGLNQNRCVGESLVLSTSNMVDITATLTRCGSVGKTLRIECSDKLDLVVTRNHALESETTTIKRANCEDIKLTLTRDRNLKNHGNINITAPQSVTISRAEDPRTFEDRIRDAS